MSLTIVLCGVVAVSVAVCVRLYLLYRHNIRKVAFMFNSIDNNDFSFNFSTRRRHGGEAALNESLNRIRDIIRRARDEAVEHEKYYSLIMDAADTGIIVADAKGHVVRHNSAALRMLRRHSLTHLCQVSGRLADGSLSQRVAYATLQDERMRIISLSDIGDELANREVDSWIKLIRVMTHEIMNTVTPITSLSASLLATAHDDQREALATIGKSARELLDFVENYRGLTHMPQPRPHAFYVKPFLERMAVLAGRSVGVSVRPADLLMYADEALMSRVVGNILRNACEAADEAGPSRAVRIWIDAYSNDADNVVIDVCNDASLIADDVAAHIFVPFFTTKKAGSGIGLALSRQIMTASGGSLRLLQDKKSGTVTFRIED